MVANVNNKGELSLLVFLGTNAECRWRKFGNTNSDRDGGYGLSGKNIWCINVSMVELKHGAVVYAHARNISRDTLFGFLPFPFAEEVSFPSSPGSRPWLRPTLGAKEYCNNDVVKVSPIS